MTRRWVFYLALNVIVSAAVALLVLLVFSRWRSAGTLSPLPGVTASARTPPPPTHVPSSTPRTYQVRPGDTLGKIADMFGVSLESLAQYNRLADPNALDVGQVLLIPPVRPGSIPTAVHATVTPAAGTPFPWPEIDFFLSVGQIEGEAIKITNPGQTTTLEGWRLQGGQGLQFTFPKFELIAGGAVLVHSGAGANTPVDLYWGRTESAWAHGDEVVLLDPSGAVRSAQVVP